MHASCRPLIDVFKQGTGGNLYVSELPRQLSISCRQTIAKQTWLLLTHMTTQLPSEWFIGTADRMALFPVRTNPRWRRPPSWKIFKWPYLRNGDIHCTAYTVLDHIIAVSLFTRRSPSWIDRLLYNLSRLHSVLFRVLLDDACKDAEEMRERVIWNLTYHSNRLQKVKVIQGH